MTRRQAITVTLGTVGAATLGGTTDAAAPPAPSKAKRKGDAERQHAWVVTDVEHGLFVPELALGPDDLGPKAPGCSMTKRVLQGGLRSGVDVVEVDNGLLRFVVVPTRGMGIWRAQCGDVRLGWDSPVRGPVHPALVRLDEPDGLGWLAGFDETLVRCGLEYNSGPEFHPSGILRYGLHGRIANTPAHKVTLAVDPATGALSVTGVVDEARLFGNKLRMVSTTSTRPGRAEIHIHDTIENLSDEPGELELIYHTNFGPPLVGQGATLVAPVKKMTPYDDVAAKDVPTWNVIGPEQPRAREICLLCELEAADDGRTGVMLRSPDGRQGVVYRFNVKQLPYFTFWKNPQSRADGYVVGFEPGTNLPNTKTVEKEQGRVITLGPRQSKTFELTLEYLSDPAAVDAAVKALMEKSKL